MAPIARHRPVALLAAALGFSLTASAAAQVPPPPPPPPAPPGAIDLSGPRQPAATGTALLLGRVVDAGDGRPIPGAFVYISSPSRTAGLDVAAEQLREMELAAVGLLPSPPAQATPVMTDPDGRFLFRSLAKGPHTLRVTMPGYSTSGYGQSRPDGGTRPVVLDDGEKRLDVTIRLWKFAAITGTVVDEAGEPAIGITVRALRRTWTGGRRRMLSTASGVTDDRGRYRIPNLVPGEYLVALPSTVTSVPAAAVDAYARAAAAGFTTQLIRERSESGAPLPSTTGFRVGDLIVQLGASGTQLLPSTSDGRIFVYPTVFYPDARTSADASAIRLDSGEERAAVDLHIRPTATVQVSGIVSGPDGAAQNLGVRLVHASAEDAQTDTGFETAVTTTDANGQFTFVGVPAGQYLLKAFRVPRPELVTSESIGVVGGITTVTTIASSASPAVGPTFFAQMPVSVGDTDLTGLALMLRGGARLSGRVEFQGSAPRPTPDRLARLGVSLMLVEGRAIAPVSMARADAEGRFTTLGHPPGRYTVAVTSPGPPWNLESVTIGGVNVLEQPLELADADVAGAVAVFTDRATELRGTVQASASAAEGATVVAFPADVRAWIADGMMIRRMATARTWDDGTYTLRIPAAGEYLVAAVPADVAIENSPEFFHALERGAARVSFAAGDSKSQSLSLSQIR